VKQLQHDGSFIQKLPGGAYRFDFSNETGLLLNRELVIPDYLPQSELLLQAEIAVHLEKIPDTIMIRDIRFAFDKSTLEESYQLYLDEIVQVMSRYPGLTLQINGYTDSRGNIDYNLRLSLLRTRAVENYLRSRNAMTDNISVRAFGETAPVAMNMNANGTDNPLGRSYNRRVELVITGLPEDVIIVKCNDVPVNLLIR
jgi:outer membrane protein OmpA-like peptidoglycan-associated protein